MPQLKTPLSLLMLNVQMPLRALSAYDFLFFSSSFSLRDERDGI